MITRIIKKNKIKVKILSWNQMRFFLNSKNIQNFDRQQFEGRNRKSDS